MPLFVSFLSLVDAGHTEFRHVSADNNALIAHDINVDGHGKKTEVVQLFGRYDILNSHCHSHVTRPLSGISFRISGGADRIPYSGSKACVLMLTECMILEGNLQRNKRS